MDKSSECLWHSCWGMLSFPGWCLVCMKSYWGGVGNENQHLSCQRLSTWIGIESQKPTPSCIVYKNSKQGRKQREGGKTRTPISLRLWSVYPSLTGRLCVHAQKIWEGLSSLHILSWLHTSKGKTWVSSTESKCQGRFQKCLNRGT